ncbi:MAG TPA: FAD-dependent monooxygenase [Rugosimonospora sp.]|nr:FAD-dependent monooxygenase [Rugosimonospora sp.]
MNTDTDVAIVGAGPTGLLLAGDLAAAGVRTTVLESRQDESNLTRAFALHARSLELLDARGLADQLVTTGQPVRGLRLFDQLSVDLSGLPSRFRYVLITPQYTIERVLEERAVAAGARIVRGAKVLGLRQDGDGVDIEAQTGAYRARYAVGADGVHSAVRTALGLEFPGQSIVRSLMLADVRLTDAPEGVLAVNAAGDCFAFVAPFGDGWYRIFAWDRRNPLPDSAPVDLEEVRAVTRRALGTDFGMHDARWLSRFHSDERQVTTYRVGRVFLGGDAAHVHTPAGGQGMNTGLQDAANLGWKLAEAVHGRAPEGLLDTYQAERHPVGRMVLRSSGAIIRLTMIQSRPGRLARNSIGAAALHVGAVTRKISGMISGIGIGYPAPSGAHALVGQRAADTLLAGEGPGPVRLYEALRDGHFVLVTAPGQPLAVPAGWADQVRRVGAGQDTDTTVLVRPDGYVAWASDKADPAALGTALGQWCLPR